jgi:hypothetical protein
VDEVQTESLKTADLRLLSGGSLKKKKELSAQKFVLGNKVCYALWETAVLLNWETPTTLT